MVLKTAYTATTWGSYGPRGQDDTQRMRDMVPRPHVMNRDEGIPRERIILWLQLSRGPDQMVGILRDTIVALVRRDGPDLSARQLGVFLTCYLQEGAHTVRGLAADLNVSKPAITRALDRLGELDLARRKVDPMDRPQRAGAAHGQGFGLPARPAEHHGRGQCPLA